MRIKKALLLVYAVIFATMLISACSAVAKNQPAPSLGVDPNDLQSESDGDNFEPVGDVPPEAKNPRAVVGPLVQTRWAHGAPHNDLYPMADDGKTRKGAGCVSVALTQVMNYHKYAQNANFDWRNMQNVYNKANYGTEQQRRAAAVLMRRVKVLKDSIGTTKVFAFFGYDKSIQSLQRKHYDDATWEAIIKAQLNAKLPVYYRHNAGGGHGHSFIVDGYDNAGKFHVNWGWRGRKDGYYSLNVLNPETDYFNLNNTMIINIKPNAGGTGSNEMALNAFAVNKKSVRQNELFTVTAQIISAGYFTGGQVGAALVDKAGRIVTVTGATKYAALNIGRSRASTISGFLPKTVKPGRYSLRMVTKTEGGEWKIVARSAFRENVPSAIDITVGAGAANSGGYGLALTSFVVKDGRSTVTLGEKFHINLKAVKVGAGAFPGGQIGVALVDKKGKIVEVINTREWKALLSGEQRSQPMSTVSVPKTVARGKYKLMVVARPAGGKWQVVTMARDGVSAGIDFRVR